MYVVVIAIGAMFSHWFAPALWSRNNRKPERGWRVFAYIIDIVKFTGDTSNTRRRASREWQDLRFGPTHKSTVLKEWRSHAYGRRVSREARHSAMQSPNRCYRVDAT